MYTSSVSVFNIGNWWMLVMSSAATASCDVFHGADFAVKLAMSNRIGQMLSFIEPAK